jgi:hypothetical protein
MCVVALTASVAACNIKLVDGVNWNGGKAPVHNV